MGRNGWLERGIPEHRNHDSNNGIAIDGKPRCSAAGPCGKEGQGEGGALTRLQPQRKTQIAGTEHRCGSDHLSVSHRQAGRSHIGDSH